MLLYLIIFYSIPFMHIAKCVFFSRYCLINIFVHSPSISIASLTPLRQTHLITCLYNPMFNTCPQIGNVKFNQFGYFFLKSFLIKTYSKLTFLLSLHSLFSSYLYLLPQMHAETLHGLPSHFVETVSVLFLSTQS